MDTTPTAMTEFKTSEYKVTIPLEIYQKIMGYVDACPIEISGLGDVEYDPATDSFVVTEVYLFKQVCTGTSTILDNDALDKFNFKRIKDNLPLPRLWWHSHANMGVFWSSTDEECMRQLKNNDYSISIVFNHAHEELCRLIQWKPFPMVADNVPVEVDFAMREVPTKIKEEVAKKVKEPTPIVYTYPKADVFTGHGSYNDRDDSFQAMLPEGIPGKQIMKLPHSMSKAVKRITELHLKAEWNADRQEWVWIQPASNRVWLDDSGILLAYIDEKYND